jgi:acyl-CoA reductase-like NAD-dependent aldehyde dehydrogenase
MAHACRNAPEHPGSIAPLEAGIRHGYALLIDNVARSAAAGTTFERLHPTTIQGETIPTDKSGALSITVRQPVGVLLSIVPWNGPRVLVALANAYPPVCGNTVAFRASESSPKIHMLVAEAAVEAGFPPEVLNALTNAPQDAPEVIDTLIAH